MFAKICHAHYHLGMSTMNISLPESLKSFVDELEKAYGHIARHPLSGSPRYAHHLGLADLRFWRLRRYPYLIFYVEREEHIDVWRVLHEQRDIPSWMSEV